MTTVATLTFTETGQSVGLLQDTTLILVQLTSKGDEITITNLGTNRSSLNGKALSNDTPSKVKDSDVITLIELNSDSSPAQDKSTRKESPVGIASSGNTSSPLKPPPAFPRSAPPSKKTETPTATTTTGTTERPKTDSLSASRAPAASTTINAITSTTAATANPVYTNLTRAHDPTNIPHSYKDIDDIHRMEIVDDSENTSDSDKEDAMDVDARSSDISAESSFICEDLTDSGNGSDSDEGH
ncbi:hypothetical protein KI688_009343 [Linnemannia hyalina]|uniref:Uncharacterized protein n=1 Tax=Linnemannia hyalina TaxID=64524 RepID=A0A9P8BW80_9FUNG|nr:hypothetical protein KI688_009343 [Linnemannia hyalina]